MSINTKNKSLYKKVIKLRKLGKSYKEISLELKVAKSTISDWLSKKNWSITLKNKLALRASIKNRKNLLKMNEINHLNALKRYDQYKSEARLEFNKLKNNKLFLTGLAIYWGEGEKTNNGRVSVVNSDNKMLEVIISFYRNVLKIPEEKLRAAMFIYKDINEERALNYWSKVLQINKKSFIKTQILPSKSKLTKTRVINGMCCVYFSNKEKSIKIREWIKLLAEEMRW